MGHSILRKQSLLVLVGLQHSEALFRCLTDIVLLIAFWLRILHILLSFLMYLIYSFFLVHLLLSQNLV